MKQPDKVRQRLNDLFQGFYQAHRFGQELNDHNNMVDNIGKEEL